MSLTLTRGGHEMHTTVPDDVKARLVGINHVALEVGDVDEAVAFYRKIFSFEVIRHTSDEAFIAMGDQFLVLVATQAPQRRAPAFRALSSTTALRCGHLLSRLAPR